MFNEIARFDKAVSDVINNEGGYSNDPLDPGGETNFGITQKELCKIYLALGLPASVKNLTKEDTRMYYKAEFWDKYHYGSIKSIKLSTKLFDMAVNLGANQAHKIAQKSCNYCEQSGLVVDGLMGSKTIEALNKPRSQIQEQHLMDYIVNNQKEFYKYLVSKKPSLKTFLKGWLNRADYEGT